MEPNALLSNSVTYDPDGVVILLDVNIYDLQRVSLHSSGGWGGSWLLFIRVEEVCHC